MLNPDIQLIISNGVNFINFFVFIIAPYAIFYFARESELNKEITISVFLVALGLNFIGVSYLVRILLGEVAPQFILGTLSIGALLILASVINMFYTRALEQVLLRKRYKKIKSIIADLKKKYYDRELSEDALREIYGELIKELAEIEFKLRKKRK